MPSGTLLPCEHQLATKRGVLEALNNTSGNIDQDRKRPRHQQHEGAAKACPASPAAQAPEAAEAAAPSPDVARAPVTAAEREADLLAALGPVIESQVREAVSRVRGGKSDPRKELRAICERLVQDLSTHQFTCLLYRFSSRGSSGAKNVLVQALCAALVQRQQADAARAAAAAAAAGAAAEAEEGWDVSRSEGSDNGSGRTGKRSGKRVPALRVVLPALPECEELQAC